jgi:SHS2 domain-containing protein
MPEKGFELIDHTADTGLIARGDTLEEAFSNAALGLFSIIAGISGIRESQSRRIEIQSRDINGLLVDWLNELVYIFDVDHLLFTRCLVKELNETGLKAICYGEKYDPARHQLRTGVKSATYHMLSVNRQDNSVRVIFDI